MVLHSNTPILVRLDGKVRPMLYIEPHTRFHVVTDGHDNYYVVHYQQICPDVGQQDDSPVTESQTLKIRKTS